MKSQGFFYNSILSDLIYNHDSKTHESLELDQCQEILSRAAIVELKLVPNDVVVLTETISQTISVLTGSGGILGLYAGFSFLSLGEVTFWIIRTLICPILNKTKTKK